MNKDSALRKRTQIAKANRTMFLWIAGGSALVGFALVASIFLAQKLFFNEKVLAEKQATITTLEHNNSVVEDLESEVRALDTNQALSVAKAQDGDQAIQAILDALPSEANSLALGASLQTKLLAGIPNLTIETLQVDPVGGVEALGDEVIMEDTGATDLGAAAISFRFTVNGNQEAFRTVLSNLERSIRTIVITSIRITSGDSVDTMVVEANAFYEPAKTLQLQDKAVRP